MDHRSREFHPCDVGSNDFNQQPTKTTILLRTTTNTALVNVLFYKRCLPMGVVCTSDVDLLNCSAMYSISSPCPSLQKNKHVMQWWPGEQPGSGQRGGLGGGGGSWNVNQHRECLHGSSRPFMFAVTQYRMTLVTMVW